MTTEDVTHRTVCEYFLKSSGVKDDLSALTDDDIDKMMKDYAAKQTKSNPTLFWLGYEKDKRRPVKWKPHTCIDVKILYSHGLNPKWKEGLKSVDGNLYRFFTECQAVRGNKEYRLDEVPSEELAFIIGIVDPKKPNEIELIDGSHRLASMILVKQAQAVNGFVGY